MNQVIEVPDIAIVKTISGTKQIVSLRDQKIKKSTLQNIGNGSGIKYNGDLYVLDGGESDIVRMTTAKVDPSFSVGKNGDISVNWGDGSIEKNVFTHTYTDGLGAHNIVFRGTTSAIFQLSCCSDQISALDVSKNIALIRLECSSNQISALDVSKNVALTNLYIQTNQISALDVSKNIKLGVLTCDDNRLSVLDLSMNTELITLYCRRNLLSSLNVSNTILDRLECRGNPFVSDITKITATANSLPDRTGKGLGDISIDNVTSENAIQSICSAKNWSIFP